MQLADWKADSAGMPGRWLRAAPRGKAAAALAMPLALLLAALLYIYWLESDVQYAGQMAMQASEARGELTQLHSSLLDAETAAIGYLATGQAGYLPRLESARSAVELSLGTLASLLERDAETVAALPEIGRLAKEEFRLLPQSLSQSGPQPALLPGKSNMGALQARVRSMSEHEERRFTQAQSARDAARRRFNGALILCAILGPLGVVFIHLAISRELRQNVRRNRDLPDQTESSSAEQHAMELRNKNAQLAHALDAAQSATAARNRFLAAVSHELRTPLNGIIGFAELMYDQKLGPVEEGQREALDDILTSARLLLGRIDDILELSNLETGSMEFRPEPCRIETLVGEVRDSIRPLAEKKRIVLTEHVPAGFAATVDPSRFKQVLYNYLSNAVKFTPAGGCVNIRVAPENQSSFRLEVEDTGIGIGPDEVSWLFQEFRGLSNGRKAEQDAGLGLAWTRRTVEAQGGTVAVRSLRGHGSVFSAVLPLETPLEIRAPAAGEPGIG